MITFISVIKWTFLKIKRVLDVNNGHLKDV